MNPKTKVFLRNVLVTPIVLLRLITMVPLSLIVVLGEWCNKLCDWFDDHLPAWKRFPMTVEELSEQQREALDRYLSSVQDSK